MKYQITITKIETETVTVNGAWTVVEKRPWLENELREEMSGFYGGRDEFLKTNPLKEVRGYAPPVQTVKVIETELLKQTVEALDLPAVLRAINKL